MAIVITFIQKCHFAFLLKRDCELQDEGECESDQSGFKRRGQSAGHSLKRCTNLLKVAGRLQRRRKSPDAQAQSQNRSG